MGGSSFDLIAQELLKQQHIMESLAEENRELRRQIAELRAGHGIFVEICGQRFPLNTVLAESLPLDKDDKAATAQSATSQPEAAPSILEDAPTVAITEQSPRATQQNTEIATAAPSPQATGQSDTSTFLEEIMLDQFSAAMTTPMAVWTEPTKKPEITEEEKKAALRRELMGSFLLE